MCAVNAFRQPCASLLFFFGVTPVNVEGDAAVADPTIMILKSTQPLQAQYLALQPPKHATYVQFKPERTYVEAYVR